MSRFSENEIVRRGLSRIAAVLYGYWEEDRVAHTRIFDVLVQDSHIYAGTSKKGNGHREHVVPCALLRDTAYAMFGDGASIEEVTDMLSRNLKVAYITKEEAKFMDHGMGLKTKMPDSWCAHTGSPLARLEAANIELE